MPQISIIVPCYNQAQYLDDCLQSVLDQTFTNWECIIVNDGSLDDTETTAKKWLEKDSRFKYLYKENGGLCSARNYGITHSLGKYILPLDGDDKIAPQYIELALPILNANLTIGLVYAEASFFGDKNEKWNLPQINSYKDLLLGNAIYCSGIYSKEDFNKIGGYDPNMIYGYEDWEFWINLLSTTNKIPFKIAYEGFYYRIKENSMANDINRIEGRKAKMLNYVLKKHIDLYQETFGVIQNIILEYNYYKKNNISSFYSKIKINITKLYHKFHTKHK